MEFRYLWTFRQNGLTENGSRLKTKPVLLAFKLRLFKMLRQLMQNKLSDIVAELEKDWYKGVEMREPNDTKIYLTGPFGLKSPFLTVHDQ